MIHRALLGSIERFFGILIEHYGGAFPVWLAPVQVKILPIADRHFEYAETVYTALQEHDIRAEMDLRNEKIGFKIREAEVNKVPYMVIIGDKEVDAGNLSVRRKGDGDLGSLSIRELLAKVKDEIDNKRNQEIK